MGVDDMEGDFLIEPERGRDWVGVAGWLSSKNRPQWSWVGGVVLGGENAGMAGKAVVQGVERRTLLAGRCAWVGGMLANGAVDARAIGRGAINCGDWRGERYWCS